MTTWPDVADKAITVALPILFTGAVAYFAAYRERKHTDKAKRRKLAVGLLEDFVKSLLKLDADFQMHLIAARDQLYRPSAGAAS